MGTIGGNLCLDTRCLWYNQSLQWRKSCAFCIKKDGDLCHVAPGGTECWAVFSGDTPAALLCLDAEIEYCQHLRPALREAHGSSTRASGMTTADCGPTVSDPRPACILGRLSRRLPQAAHPRLDRLPARRSRRGSEAVQRTHRRRPRRTDCRESRTRAGERYHRTLGREAHDGRVG